MEKTSNNDFITDENQLNNREVNTTEVVTANADINPSDAQDVVTLYNTIVNIINKEQNKMIGNDQNDLIEKIESAYEATHIEFQERALNPKWFGAIGNGLADDTDAIQTCLDVAQLIKANNSVPNDSVKIIFPFGKYMISKPLIVRGTVKIDFAGAHTSALNEMEQMMIFESHEMIPGIVFDNILLNGNGLARNGLVIQDVYLAHFNNIQVFACTKINVLITNKGFSNNCECSISGGVILNGVQPRAGGHQTCINSIGLQVIATDCIIKDLITRDFKTHIYNLGGINFYSHCHGWNMVPETMKDSVYFKLDWDADIISCYSDTIQYAFEFAGDGRHTISNFYTSTNPMFYTSDKYGPLRLFKVTGKRGNRISFVNARFDANGTDAKICDSDDYVNFIDFIGVTNIGYTPKAYIVDKYTRFSPATANPDVNIWNFHLTMQSNDEADFNLAATVSVSTVNNSTTLTLCTLPNRTFNKYYSIWAQANVESYGNPKENRVCPIEISQTGAVKINLSDVSFTSKSDVRIALTIRYRITV